MSKKQTYYQTVYTRNPETGAYQIAVSLDDYNDVFDDWDPSPFKKRDIESEFHDYIVDSSEDIPLREPIELCLYVPEQLRDTAKEQMLRAALKIHFEFLQERMQKESRQDQKRAISYVAMAIGFLGVGILSLRGIYDNVVLQIINEGLFIGGWVFLWEAFTLMAFDLRRIGNNVKAYKRFLQAVIRFYYT